MTAMVDSPGSILAFRNGSIGNTLVAVPALRALRRHCPEAALHVVVDSLGAELLRHCPWIDSLIVYQKRGADRGVGGTWRLVRRLRALHPTHAILFKRFFRNGLLARLSGAPVRLGFTTEGSAPFLNRTIPYDPGENVARLNLRLVAALGAPVDDERPEIWLSPEDREAADAWLTAAGIAGRGCLVAHYGGLSTPPDFLSRAVFARLVRRAAGDDLEVVLLTSGERERRWAEELGPGLPGARIAADLPIRVAAALLARARRFLGFNSGPAHLAAAVGTPAHILFRPGAGVEREITRWLPLHPLARPLRPPDTGEETALEEWVDALALDPSSELRPERSVV